MKSPHFISMSMGGCVYDYNNMTSDEHSKAVEFHSKENYDEAKKILLDLGSVKAAHDHLQSNK